MPETVKVPFTTGNKIWGTYKNYPYKAWFAVAELVDNSTQSYFDHRDVLDPVLKAENRSLEVSVHFDPQTRELEVTDNSIGMDLETLSHAVLLAEPPANTSGRSEFGMGMKTACSWLGSEWGVRTKRLGNLNEYSFWINIPEHSKTSEQTLPISVKNVGDLNTHYTVLTVRNVRKQFQGPAIGTLKRRLAEIYRRDIENGILTLLWRGEKLEPNPITPLETTVDAVDENGHNVTVTRTWKQDVSFDVEIDPESDTRASVSGWIAVVVPGGRTKAGFDLLRRGRVIVGRPTGYRPEPIFGTDAPNSVINQRLYGELNLDDFPVNHLKSDFQWEGWQDEFDAKLKKAAENYVSFANAYRPTKEDKTVPPAVVQTANDDVAEILDNDKLAAEINILETVGPPPLPNEAVRQAEADVLRDQPVEPRVVELLTKTYRIYHPASMRPEQSYVRFEAASRDEIDIFVNDNHPYVATLDVGAGNAERYSEHLRHCVWDAMAAHILTNLGEAAHAERFIQVKDRLLRGS